MLNRNNNGVIFRTKEKNTGVSKNHYYCNSKALPMNSTDKYPLKE